MHSEPGLLSMAGSDPPPRGGAHAAAPRRDCNASQFFITTKSTTQALGGARIAHLDYRHVVFGKVARAEGGGRRVEGGGRRVQRVQRVQGKGERAHPIKPS